METEMKEANKCEACGYTGKDVVWENNNKPGYYCKDWGACFKRYQELRYKEVELY